MAHVKQSMIQSNTSFNIILAVLCRYNNVIPLSKAFALLRGVGWEDNEIDEVIEEMASEDLFGIRYGRVDDYIVL